MIASVITALIPIFGLMAIGSLLRQVRWVPKEADPAIMKLVVGLFYPALILRFILNNPALEKATNVFLPPLFGFLFIVLGFFIANRIGRMFGLKMGQGLRSFTFCSGIQNYGYIPIPLIALLLDDPGTLGVLMVHNVGVEAAIWTVGVFYLQGTVGTSALKRLINPPIIALFLALTFNYSGAVDMLPAGVFLIIEWLSSCAIPVGLLLAGAGLRDLLGDKRIWREWKPPTAALLTRLGVIPACIIAVAVWMPGLSPELRHVLIIQGAMPAGIFPIVLTRHFGGDVLVAVQVVVATTVGSIITIPLWLGYFL